MALTNKRHLILTGGRGVGKTTLLNALAEGLPGIATKAVPMKRVDMADRVTGESFPIGRFDPHLPGTENRMAPVKENLEGRAVKLLNALRETESEGIAIDEIGYLEADCPSYREALEALMGEKHVAAVVRKQNLPFLQEILRREDACVVDLDDPFGNLGCVIMASGLGKRFGGNKLLADFEGQPLITRILDATEGIFAQRVVVTRHEEVARLCEARGIPAVLHDLPHRSDTVRLGLEALGERDGWVFCPADQPLLTKETMELLALWGRFGKICQLSFEDRAGTPVLFPKWCGDELKALPEGKGGSVLIKKYPEQVQKVPAREGYELWDADTPDELEALRQISRAGDGVPFCSFTAGEKKGPLV